MGARRNFRSGGEGKPKKGQRIVVNTNLGTPHGEKGPPPQKEKNVVKGTDIENK